MTADHCGNLYGQHTGTMQSARVKDKTPANILMSQEGLEEKPVAFLTDARELRGGGRGRHAA